jgi:UDP-glucose 4-epimerase
MSQRILITGGLGCVGGRLARYLSATGQVQVMLGSRHPVGTPAWLASATTIQTQWDSDESLRDACAGVDAVVHLAGMNASECAADPVGALEFNGVATGRLLRAAIAAGVRRFIYVSTAHVYGSPLLGRITERSVANATHPYATSHRAGEDQVLFMHQRKAIEGVAIRMSNSFGPPAHEDVNCWMLLVNDLCRQAAATRRLVLNSAGTQRRDFVTLTDACRAIDHLLRLRADELGDGLFNLGGAWAPTIMEMTSRIAARCNEVLGFVPPILRPVGESDGSAPELDFRLDTLRATGFELLADVDAEIVMTLKFCASLRSGAERL